jgi:hypothetical protein
MTRPNFKETDTMAKKRSAKAHHIKPVHATSPADNKQPSTATRKLVDAIRSDFGTYAENFGVITADRASLAPRFMAAFDAWSAETGGTFVAFVRLLDPSVPEDRDGYRAHNTYQAADFLRRKLAQASRPELPPGKRPVSVYDALAMLVATVLPAVDPNGTIWNAFVKEVKWTKERADALRERATKLGAAKLPPRTKHTLDTLAKAA